MGEHKATIYYHDIGDYLDRTEKLAIIKEYGSVMNSKMGWEKITPNEKHDWINQRDGTFDEMILIGDKDDKQNERTFFVAKYSNGAKTNRDVWAYNLSKQNLLENVKKSIEFYNEEVTRYSRSDKNVSVEDFIDSNPAKISWSRAYRNDVQKGKKYGFSDAFVYESAYRPFFKQNLYFHRNVVNDVALLPSLFPTPETKNLVICVPGIGNTKDFSVIITDTIPDLGFNSACQCFPLYYYEENKNSLPELNFGDEELSTVNSQFSIKHAITDWILAEVRCRFQTSGKSITKEHIFYYVYGILHSKQYRERFASDLKKSLPRIPIVDDINTFMDFYNAGKRLADLHLNYENVSAYDGVTLETIKPVVYKIPSEKPKLDLDYGELMAAEPSPKFTNDFDEYQYYSVEKMRFPQKGQKDTIIYNHYITIKNIPAKAYDYIVNGKSAIEWIMERYCVSTDKASGIKNDCNDWAREHEKPRYVLDLLLSVINVSVQTAEIVEGLPKVEW